MRVQLILRSPSLTRQALDERSGLASDGGWVLGEPRARSALVRWKDHGSWVRSRLPPEAALRAHIEDVFERIRPAREAIRGLAADPFVRAVLFVGMTSGEDGIQLPPQLLAELADLRLELEIDVLP